MKNAITKQIVNGGFAMLAMLAGAISSASAAVVVDDNFEGPDGSLPNPDYWITSPIFGAPESNVTLDGNGNVVLNTTAAGFQRLSGVSSLSAAPTGSGEDEYYVITFSNLSSGPYGINMGLYSGADFTGSRIILRNDLGNGVWNMDINNGGQTTYLPLDVSNTTLGTFRIEWHTDQVLAYLDDSLIFDSIADLPANGDATWSIPTIAMAPNVGQYGGDILAIGGVTYESIPEPGMTMLGILGGMTLLCFCKRAIHNSHA